MALFPHTMIRIGGGAFDGLEKLRLSESSRLAEELGVLKGRMGAVKTRICEALYALLPALPEEDAAIRNRLLNLRRDIFSGRWKPGPLDDEAAARLNPELLRDLAEYGQWIEQTTALSQRGEHAFSAETAAARIRLQKLALDENLHKGLLLSSLSLYRRINDYVRQTGPLKKKDGQTERGLAKYIWRMLGKTSPFSAFTNLMIARHENREQHRRDNGNAAPLLFSREGEPSRVICHIRLNNYLFAYLKVLFTRNPNIYRRLCLRVNPTLQKKPDHYLFLTNSNNIESFQRIPDNPALEVFRILVSRDLRGMAYQNLVREILDNEYIDAPEEDLEAFLNQLLEYGFLEFDLGVSGIDPDWDRSLADRLGYLGEEIPLLGELFGVLKKVRELAEEYGGADCSKRLHILDEAYDLFRGACWKIHEDAGLPAEERRTLEEIRERRFPGKAGADKRKPDAPQNQTNGDEPDLNRQDGETGSGEAPGGDEDAPFKQYSNTAFIFTPEKMFYEDTSNAAGVSLDQQVLEDFTTRLHRLLSRMRPFEGHGDEREKMLFYFTRRYGAGASVDLLTFYEDYYRDYKKPEAMRRRKKDNEAGPELPAIPGVEARAEAQKRWMSALAARLRSRVAPGSQTVQFSLEDIGAVNLQVFGTDDFPDINNSYGCFTQFYRERGADGRERTMAMLNGAFGGYGRMLSRFLHIFDKAVVSDLRAWNSILAGPGALYLEDQDASFFNANLHPPLMPLEIWTPNGQNSLPPEQRIPIMELTVSEAPSGDQLQLIHAPSGKRVFVFDLGFQGYMGRSQLFNLLEKFTASELLFPNYINGAVNALYGASGSPETAAAGKGGVRFTPRIVYEDSIVLQRRSWSIDRERIPFREPGETDWAWFCRLNEWRRELHIPNEVFLFATERIMPDPSAADAAGKEENRLTPDDYKPQYISFHDPFSVQLLEKAFGRMGRSLRLTEMLPAPDQLFDLDGRRYVMEFVVHWYTSDKGDEIFQHLTVPPEVQS